MTTISQPKSRKTKTSATSAAHKTEVIRLSLHSPEAHTVCLAGSFNDWQPDHLQSDAEGEWSIELSLPPGEYEYLFVVDERWQPDPAGTESRPNPFGGENSVLHVPAAKMR
jgi:1,4-alpha-glucan branching enzyme